jgi:hypothetical protein
VSYLAHLNVCGAIDVRGRSNPALSGCSEPSTCGVGVARPTRQSGGNGDEAKAMLTKAVAAVKAAFFLAGVGAVPP